MPSSDDRERLDRILRGLSEFEEEQGLAKAPRFGRYEILGKVGEGGSAVVYRARDRDLDRIVAIKVLRGGAMMSPVARERFQREARAAAGLGHTNVVTVHDFGEEQGSPFLVMEFIDGRPLVSGKSADPRASARLLEKAARGVAAAHGKGIVHRDLKPGNILVDAQGEPKVADFGLAHLMTSTDHLTRTGATVGTPLYMAPEQIEARVADISPRTDVYALGTILYEALTGQVPFLGETMAEITHKILRVEPRPPAGPTDLVTICLKAMEKDPERRYPTAAAFADDLSRFLEGRPIQARPPSVVYRATRWAARQRTPVLGVITVGLLAVLAALMISRRPSGPLATVSWVQGEVFRLSESGRQPLRTGEAIFPGQGVETSGPRDRAALSFPDGTSIAAGGETRVNELARTDGEGPATHRLFLVRGILKVALAPSSAAGIRLGTPHGEATAARGRFTLSASTETVLEVWEGAVSFGRSTDPRKIEVSSGQYAIAAPEKELASRANIRAASDDALLFAEDFEDPEILKKRWAVQEASLPYTADGRLEVDLGARAPPLDRPYGRRVSLYTLESFSPPFRVSLDIELTHNPQGILAGLRVHGKDPANFIHADLMDRYLLDVGGQPSAAEILRPLSRRERWVLEVGVDRVRFLVDDRELMKATRGKRDDRFEIILLAARAGPELPGARVRFDNVVVERVSK
jgi:serine/threonine-protein kinase